MYEESPLERELAAAVALSVPDDAPPFVLGDFVGVVEAATDAGTGVVVVARDLQPRHLRLLLRAAEQIVEHHVESDQASAPPEDGTAFGEFGSDAQ